MKPFLMKAVPGLAALLFLSPRAAARGFRETPGEAEYAAAAPRKAGRPAQPRGLEKNGVTTFLSPVTLTFLGYDAELAYVWGVEYTRRIKGRWLWGLNLSYSRIYRYYDCEPVEGAVDTSVERNITRLTANAYYELPAGRRTSLRFGAGVGVGWHLGEMSLSCTDGDSRFMPYVNFDLTGIARLGKHFVLEFAPLVIGPSWVAWSPFKFDHRYSYRPLQTDAGFTFRLGIGF